MDLKHFYFRLDASPIIGSGHLVRSLHLAKALKRRGAKVSFVSRNLSEEYTANAISSNIRVIHAPDIGSPIEPKANDYKTWLGASEEIDVSQFLSYFGSSSNNVIIADHYGIGEIWTSHAKNRGHKVIAFDDMAEQRLNTDVLINQNLGWKDEHYSGLVKPHTKLLLGPKYAVLAENYASVRELLVRDFDRDTGLKVLISLGGSDAFNVSKKIVVALLPILNESDCTITIVVGALNPNQKSLEKLCSRSAGKIKLLYGKSNLAEAYASSDFAIGSVGGSSWERCCLGLPTILVPVADNQIPAAKTLNLAGAGILVKASGEHFESELCEAFKKMCKSKLRLAVSRNAMQICDGNGAERVCDEIIKNTLYE